MPPTTSPEPQQGLLNNVALVLRETIVAITPEIKEELVNVGGSLARRFASELSARASESGDPTLVVLGAVLSQFLSLYLLQASGVVLPPGFPAESVVDLSDLEEAE